MKAIRLPTSTLASGLLVIAVFVALYGLFRYSAGYLDERVSILATAWSLWQNYPDWQHGAIVPLIAAGLIWFQRDKLRGLSAAGSWWGLPILGVAFVLFWLGYMVDHYYLGFASAQVFLAGVIVWLLGWSFMRALAFPWLFLCFTWPILYLDNALAFPLRILMTDLSFQSLTGMGVQCVRSGSAVLSAPDYMLHLPMGARFAVDIANPCSGIQSLFALMMVSALYGYLTLPRVWQRILLFGASIPFAVLGNLVRILMLTFGTLMFGEKFAIGTDADPSFFHMFAGFFVFVIALCAMIAMAWALRQDWPALLTQGRATLREWRSAKPRPMSDSVITPREQTSDVY